MKSHRASIVAIVFAVAVTIPGVYLRLSGIAGGILQQAEHTLGSVVTLAVLSGLAILGASFILLWTCDVAQKDISQTLALAIVALVAVLPEYAVDMYFTWMAGQNPDGDYAHYAIANMTGANRLLIGIAWTAVAVIFWFVRRKAVQMGPERRTELFFLGMATLYAFLIPLKGSLEWYDAIVFIGIYIWYIVIASKRPVEEVEIEGPAELICTLPQTKRRLATLGMFLFAAGVILANAESFSEGLVSSGKLLHINEFLLVQWLAPIASEAPEFIVAIMFTLRGQAGMALGSLLSSKLNQWTLLVGMIPAVYGISAGTLAHPIPMDIFQMHEILLTAAQSILAVVILSCLRLSVSQAALIFFLFIGQFVAPPVVDAFPGLAPFGLQGENVHQLFSVIYIAIAIAFVLDNPGRLKDLWRGLMLKTDE